MGRFHKALPNVKSAYVILQDFTPDLQKNYTDISAISVTLCNSVETLYFPLVDVYQTQAFMTPFVISSGALLGSEFKLFELGRLDCNLLLVINLT